MEEYYRPLEKNLVGGDITEYKRINAHILTRLSKVSVVTIPARAEQIINRAGYPEIKIIPKKYQIFSSIGSSRYHVNAINIDNIEFANRPFCKFCRTEFVVNDKVVVIHYPITTTGERARIGGKLRIRWIHVKCFDGEEGSDRWKQAMRMDISQMLKHGYINQRPNDPRLTSKTVKRGRVKGARAVIISMLPAKGQEGEWVSDEDLFKTITKFFPGSKRIAIQAEIDAFVNKYRDRIIIDESGVLKYRWRGERAWQPKKDRVRYAEFLKSS